jgi:pilus assembly protein CpaF
MFSESLRAFLKPVVPFLDDPGVSEILINGPEEVWIERAGLLSRTDARFSEEGLLAAARNMAQYVGRPLSDERPRLDARLPDGSRIHVVLPPVARRGTTVSIRKFFPDRLTVAQLVAFGSVSPQLARLLEALVALRLNLVVSGGTGSGKTSLLNVLSSMIAPHERILTIEDSAELQLQQPHLVSFESRPADRLGKGEVGIGDLLHSALRLRPDRIVVGEVRGGECFYLLQAMNTGHGGSMTTAHANTPVDTLRRLESLCLLAGFELPLRAVRAQVASAVHIVVCCERLADGSRKVTSVAEVLPLDEKGDYRAQELFVFQQTGRGPKGEVLGFHAPTGVLPTFLAKLQAAATGLEAAFFDPAAQGLSQPSGFLQDLGPQTRWASGRAPALAPGEAPPAGPALPSSEPVRLAPLGAVYHAATAPSLPAVSPPQAAGGPSLVPPPSPAPLAPLAAAEAAGAPVQVPALAPVPHLPKPLSTPPALPVPPAEPGKVRAPGAVRTTTLSGPRKPAGAAAPATPPPPVKKEPSSGGSSIELDPDLEAEVEAALPYESTLITRNPLLEQRPSAREDETTNPGARHPRK